jgi:predicted TIM-barrel fold metal-dependent hydrolase
MIDIHAHLFNLKYLPVAGIIRRYGKNKISPAICNGIEKYFLRKTESSIDIEPEIEQNELGTEKNLYKIAGKIPVSFHHLPIFDLTLDNVKDGLSSMLTLDDLNDPSILAALSEYETSQYNSLVKSNSLAKIQNFQQELSQQEARNIIDLFKGMLDWVFKIVAGARSIVLYIRWFYFMTKSEHEMLDRLKNVDSPGVDLFVHHMMDVDGFFDDGDTKYLPHFKYETEQVPKMLKITKQFSNKLICFVAFNPDRPNSLDIVKKAIRDGFTGVKFYPPLGYCPYNDPIYKDQINALYEFCIEKDVPLFTHCNKEGFEADRENNSGHNSNPKYWEKVLIQFPKLRLCLAHAGGVEGWFDEIRGEEQIHVKDITPFPNDPEVDEKQPDWNNSYAKIVYKLCLEYDNVYCDAAYLDEVTEETEYLNFKIRLIKLFAAEPDFSKKIVYGSDWHMLFQEAKNKRYLSDYVRLFNESCFTPEQRNDFFDGNARRYLKLI